MLHIDTEDAHAGGHDGRASDQPKQPKDFDSSKHTDKKQQLVQVSAIAKQQRTQNVIGDAGDDTTNHQYQQPFSYVHTDKKQQLVQVSAIAKQQRTQNELLLFIS